MIRSDAEMAVNLESITGMYRAIARLKRDIAPLNFNNYLIFAEGPIDQISRLKQEIDEYLGIPTSSAGEVEASAAVGAERG